MKIYVLPFWPGLPGRRDFNGIIPDKIKDNNKSQHEMKVAIVFSL